MSSSSIEEVREVPEASDTGLFPRQSHGVETLGRRLGIHIGDGDRVLVLGHVDKWLTQTVEGYGGRLSAANPLDESDLTWARSQRGFDCVLALQAGGCRVDELAEYFRSFIKPRASLFVWHRDRCFLSPRTKIESPSELLVARGKHLGGALTQRFRILKSTAVGIARGSSAAARLSVIDVIMPSAVLVMELTGRG